MTSFEALLPSHKICLRYITQAYIQEHDIQRDVYDKAAK